MECVFVFFFVLFIANVVFSTMLAFLMVGVVNTDWGIAPEDNIEEKDLFMLDTRYVVDFVLTRPVSCGFFFSFSFWT